MRQKEAGKIPHTAIRRIARRQAVSALSSASKVRQEGETAGKEQTVSPEQEAENRLQKDMVQPFLSVVDTGAAAASDAVKMAMRKRGVRKKAMGEKREQREQELPSDEAFPVPPKEAQPFQQMDLYSPDEAESGCTPTAETPLQTHRESARGQNIAKEVVWKNETKKNAQKCKAEQGSNSRTVCEMLDKSRAEKRTPAALKGAAGPVQNGKRDSNVMTGKSRETVRRHFMKRIAIHRHASGTTQLSGRILHIPQTPLLRSGRPGAAHTRAQNLLRRIGERLRAALGKMLRKTAASLIAMLGAGGIVLLLIVAVGAAAAVIGSPMGILFANQTDDPGALSVAEVVRETNAAFGQAVNELTDAYPEADEVAIRYIYANGGTWASYWPEVLAVFAVHTNLTGDSNVVVIDNAKAQAMQNIFWDMNELTVELEHIGTEENEPSGETDAEAAPPQERQVLHITVSGRTADEMADLYNFTADQRDILHELLSAEMRPMLVALCGSVIPGAGSDEPGLVGNLLWPLPGYNTITTHFGEPDAIRGLPHRGIDIAAPEGTPILAVHGGTVLISGWNDSYGNQVLLDNGAGLSTRYAHMTATAVNAGEIVTAGQVIGYVGSTGDSTGNHLHFELKVDGVLTDPGEDVSKMQMGNDLQV